MCSFLSVGPPVHLWVHGVEHLKQVLWDVCVWKAKRDTPTHCWRVLIQSDVKFSIYDLINMISTPHFTLLDFITAVG